MLMTVRMGRGEILNELKAVLEKARTLLVKSEQMGGEERSAVDITSVLLGFMNQKVIGDA